jgi:hypothetical protein
MSAVSWYGLLRLKTITILMSKNTNHRSPSIIRVSKKVTQRHQVKNLLLENGTNELGGYRVAQTFYL